MESVKCLLARGDRTKDGMNARAQPLFRGDASALARTPWPIPLGRAAVHLGCQSDAALAHANRSERKSPAPRSGDPDEVGIHMDATQTTKKKGPVGSLTLIVWPSG